MADRPIKRVLQDDPAMPVHFCDVAYAVGVDDGVYISLYQTSPPVGDAEAATVRPIAKVLVSWQHLERLRTLFNEVATERAQ